MNFSHPRMHFPVAVYNLAFRVDGDTGIQGVRNDIEGVLLHYAESSPDYLLGVDGLGCA